LDVCEAWLSVATGDVVTASWVLEVGGSRRLSARNASDCGYQATDVGFSCVDAGAGPHCPRHSGAVTSAHLVTEIDNLVFGETQEPHHIGMRAKTAVPDADPLLRRQPGCHKAVRETFHGEGRDRQGVDAKIWPEDAHPWDSREFIPQ
jgi:hypothetical protein